MSVENLVDKASKRIGNVHPVIKQGAEEIIRRAYKKGIYVLFSDGYRSHAEQNELYAQGRTRPGSIVTNARGGQSMHNYGLALDMFITNKEGTTASWPTSTLRQVAQIAKALGFEWGGDWKNFKDYPHIQMTGGLSIAQLRAGHKPKIKLKTGSNSKPSKPKTKPSKPSSSTKPSTSKESKWTEKSGNWTGGVLRLNDKGKQVTQLQEMLAANHFYPEKGAKNNGVDGYYGANTKDAVERYQSMNGLTVDGVAGQKTYNKLKGSKSSNNEKDKKYPLPNGVLSRGSKGNAVKQLQRALNAANFKVGKVDGDYGAKTEGAVRRFQKVHDAYNVDGDYGPRTKERLDKMIN